MTRFHKTGVLLCSALLAFATALPSREARAQTPPAPTTPPTAKIPSQVTVLGYHRFEQPAKDPLAITPEDFRKQMQALKDAGITVIPMADFLAWRKGEKEIPERSAVITIDDGYNCTYSIAWPILKEFGYPFTFYVYTNYISAGGRSIKWEQLEEMRDAGVDIGSHSVSHDNLVRPRRNAGAPYDAWLDQELAGSKKILEERLGIPMRTFAYPYGIHNDAVAARGLDAGYEALFTVVGKKLTADMPPGTLGRYVIQSDKPQTFSSAIQFGPGSIRPDGTGSAGPTIAVFPAHRSTIADSRPEIRADLSTLGKIDPQSVQMRISGLGLVAPEFNPETGMLTFRPNGRLHHKDIQVQIRARAAGKPFQTTWEFFWDPKSLTPDASLMIPVEEPSQASEFTETPPSP